MKSESRAIRVGNKPSLLERCSNAGRRLWNIGEATEGGLREKSKSGRSGAADFRRDSGAYMEKKGRQKAETSGKFSERVEKVSSRRPRVARRGAPATELSNYRVLSRAIRSFLYYS